MRGGRGRAGFTGKSASSKVVSGRSTPGTAHTQTAVPSRKRTNIQRTGFTLPTPSGNKVLSPASAVNAVSDLNVATPAVEFPFRPLEGAR